MIERRLLPCEIPIRHPIFCRTQLLPGFEAQMNFLLAWKPISPVVSICLYWKFVI